jgi:hypothetical protein
MRSSQPLEERRAFLERACPDAHLRVEVESLDVEMSGPIYAIGGGVNYFLNPALALAPEVTG